MPPLHGSSVMPPLMVGDDSSDDNQDLSCDRFSSCSNVFDAAPSSTRIVEASPAASRNRIIFDANVLVQLIPSRSEYTSEEMNDSWYSSAEKELMYDTHAETVRRMETGKRPKKNTTYRGLENWLDTNAEQLDRTVHACIDAVMDEQDRQWDELESNIVDWDRFREESLTVSRQSAILAFKMAAYDECEAGKAYVAMANQEMKQKRRRSIASVCTQDTEVTDTTLVRETREKHKVKIVNTVKRLGRNKSGDIKKTKKKKPKKKPREPKKERRTSMTMAA